MTAKMKIGLIGATGRMGQEIIRFLDGHQQADLVLAWTHSASTQLGRDSGLVARSSANGLMVTDDCSAWKTADVLIDFGVADGFDERLQAYQVAGRPVVICATGLSDQQHEKIQQLAHDIPLVYAANTSLGINLLTTLTEQAARILGTRADIEILEAHHTRKLDAPSGTALLLGESAARGRGQNLADVAEFQRNHATLGHPPGSIGFASLRAGDIVGEHTVYFALGGERLELTHRVANRSTFAEGAVHAASWLVQQKSAGFYTMRDVLGLDASSDFL